MTTGGMTPSQLAAEFEAPRPRMRPGLLTMSRTRDMGR